MHTMYIIVYVSLCWLPGNVKVKCYEMKNFNTPRAACKFTEAIVGDWSSFRFTEQGMVIPPLTEKVELVCVNQK